MKNLKVLASQIDECKTLVDSLFPSPREVKNLSKEEKEELKELKTAVAHLQEAQDILLELHED